LAIKWAAANGITVSIDSHGAPGSQNGANHSGQEGKINWDKNPENIKLTVKVLGMISESWGKNPTVWGIKMLNEPGSYGAEGPIDRELLTGFYHDGYAAIRQHLPTVHVVMNSFVTPNKWIWSVLPKPQYRNVVLNLHFHTPWSGYTQEQQYYNTAADWGKAIRALTLYYPVVVGEWSLATGRGFPPKNTQLFADASMKLFVENAFGFVFWSYKLREKNEAWAFKDAFNYVKKHYLPASVKYYGCNSCTQAVWDTIATDVTGSYSCGARISWLQTQGFGEAATCQKVASEFPAVCLCDSKSCTTGSPAPTPPVPTSYCG
jgi:glucan 1,3-beta-glucosidase